MNVKILFPRHNDINEDMIKTLTDDNHVECTALLLPAQDIFI